MGKKCSKTIFVVIEPNPQKRAQIAGELGVYKPLQMLFFERRGTRALSFRECRSSQE